MLRVHFDDSRFTQDVTGLQYCSDIHKSDSENGVTDLFLDNEGDSRRTESARGLFSSGSMSMSSSSLLSENSGELTVERGIRQVDEHDVET